MQSDTVHTVNGLNWTQRLERLRTTAVRLQTRRDEAVRSLSDAKSKSEQLGEKVEVLTKGGELLRLLMDKLALDHVKMIESVVTEGLQTIFVDQDLNFEAEVGTYRNKVAIDLLIRRKRNGIEVVGPPLESTGGGISSIASLTLRLLALMRLKKFPFLLLDETLSAVSDEYVDATGQFLAKLAVATKIPILLVTHKQAFLDHAENAYRGDEKTEPNGDLVMSLTKLRGNG